MSYIPGIYVNCLGTIHREFIVAPEKDMLILEKIQPSWNLRNIWTLVIATTIYWWNRSTQFKNNDGKVLLKGRTQKLWCQKIQKGRQRQHKVHQSKVRQQISWRFMQRKRNPIRQLIFLWKKAIMHQWKNDQGIWIIIEFDPLITWSRQYKPIFHQYSPSIIQHFMHHDYS